MNQFTANIDPETGIRYGVIAINSLADWVLDGIYSNGEDLDYLEAYEDFKKDLLTRYMSPDDPEIAELLEEFGQNFEIIGENSTYRYETDGITVQTSGESNLWVFKSPAIVNARQCSPCYPNAGDLDSIDAEYGVKTYGLPADWLRKDGE